ncbi:MAG: hypothetical protein QXL54_02425 [Candidatus Bathyarchaeia archaeon]
MVKTAKTFRTASSGQLLIVAALAIAIVIVSTSIYIYEVTTQTQSVENNSMVELAIAVKTGIRNAVISALANITNGGQKTILAENLDMLARAYMQLHPQKPCLTFYTLLNGTGYEDGVKLLWDADGLGVSSAHVFFTLKVLEPASNITINDAINITTVLKLDGYTVNENENVKIVNLTCKVLNEGKPAQAKQIAVYWEQAPKLWVPVQSPYIADLGNGTYTISFIITAVSDILHVSAHVVDARNIFAIANATCTQAD